MTTRRRMLTILAGVAALPVLGAKASPSVENWRGVALGADARIILDHPNAQQLIAEAVQEIHRLENIFSLHLANSQLSQLNRDGALLEPAFEMVELLSICSGLNARTKGAFDPTVQSLWSLYAREFAAGGSPDAAQIAQAKAVTGWERVSFSPTKVFYAKVGVAMTLNGVAQGFIADKVATYFRQNGVSNVLVDTGEIAALGLAPTGNPWQIRRNDVDGMSIPLSNAAIATSAPLGTVFDAGGTVGHIIDPRTGRPGGRWTDVSVISLSAAEADGLSTAFCLMDKTEISAAVGRNEVLLGHEI